MPGPYGWAYDSDVVFSRLILALVSVAVLGGGPPSLARAGVASFGGASAVAQSTRATFEEWIKELRQEALARGFSPSLVARALGQVEALPVVVERDRTQVERTISIERYLSRRVTPRVVRDARGMDRRHRSTLRRVEATYGVPSRVLVAIWGLESNFGRFSGVRPTIAALATLAYDDRRGRFFRAQIFDALTIVDRGHIELERLTGSWAGAMGQVQFLPSSYLKYAVDFDEDGRRDIWRSHADIFASIANYLFENGWRKDTIWGREVRMSRAVAARVEQKAPNRDEGCEAERQMSEPLPLERWTELGVTLARGRPLPRASVEASLVRTEKRAFLVYRNYEALLEYNCAHSYALSVALLADRIGG